MQVLKQEAVRERKTQFPNIVFWVWNLESIAVLKTGSNPGRHVAIRYIIMT